MHELNEQKKLTNIVFEKDEQPPNHQGFKIYKALVFHRFFEVLSNAYPLWYKIVDKGKFKKALYEFMRYGAKSDVVWKMPNEFRRFIKKSNLFDDISYLDDLMWFEWIEVELMMKNYKPHAVKKFSFSHDYRLSRSCVVKKLKHRVFEEENFEQKGEYYLLAYYDFGDYEVYYREISEVLFIFLKELGRTDLKIAIKKVARLSGSSQKETKEFFKGSLRDLADTRVIERI